MGRVATLINGLLLATATAVLLTSLASAQTAVGSSFDHFSTGFPLTGAHVRVECGSCHVNARFRGTPRPCVACHNNTPVQGKPNSHPLTSNLCEQCHVTYTWNQINVDHAGIMANCATCHNGTIALGKSANHLPTVQPCETCHKNTVSFLAGVTFDHTGITGACATCHNGTSATGLTSPPQ